MAQQAFTTTTPLGAGEIFDTGWRFLDPASPYVHATVSSDQSGTLTILEREGEATAASPNIATTVNIPITGGAPAQLVQAFVRSQQWRLTYTNGATAQVSFSLGYYSYPGEWKISQTDLLWKVLKELRAISMLLAALKEPTGQQPNLPYGIDPVEPT